MLPHSPQKEQPCTHLEPLYVLAVISASITFFPLALKVTVPARTPWGVSPLLPGETVRGVQQVSGCCGREDQAQSHAGPRLSSACVWRVLACPSLHCTHT